MKNGVIRAIILFTVLLLFAAQSAADTNKAGGTSMNFLSIDVDARAIGMGSAFSAATDAGASSLFWNLGSMVFVKNVAASFTHTVWIADISHDAVGIVYSLGEKGTVGISFVRLGSPEMKAKTELVEDPSNNKKFTFSDVALGVAYAKRVTDVFSIGAQLKYVREDVGIKITSDQENPSTVALDLGGVYTTNVKGFRIGAVLRNFGQDVKYFKNTGISWPLPVVFRVGVAMEPLTSPMGKLTTSVDISKLPDLTTIYNVGAEYWVLNMLALRAGVKGGLKGNSEEGVSFGAGLKVKQLSADYAFTDFGIFNDVHRVSVGVNF